LLVGTGVVCVSDAAGVGVGALTASRSVMDGPPALARSGIALSRAHAPATLRLKKTVDKY
jgi:hypothetical protein